MKNTLYLAYGSNLSMEQMARRCPTAVVLGDTVLKDYRLVFRGIQGNTHATVEEAQGYFVPVIVWSLCPADEAALDIYEGFPLYYRKEYVTVKMGRSKRKAMLYVMNDNPLGVPSTSYFNVIKDAYKSLGFDIAILLTALRESKI